MIERLWMKDAHGCATPWVGTLHGEFAAARQARGGAQWAVVHRKSGGVLLENMSKARADDYAEVLDVGYRAGMSVERVEQLTGVEFPNPTGWILFSDLVDEGAWYTEQLHAES